MYELHSMVFLSMFLLLVLRRRGVVEKHFQPLASVSAGLHACAVRTYCANLTGFQPLARTQLFAGLFKTRGLRGGGCDYVTYIWG